MIQFFAPEIANTLTLPETDSGHAVRVLRMHSGDILQVIDGKGNIYTCRLEDAHSKHATVSIIESRYQPVHWPCRIELAVAPTKNMDRMEWLVEKCVEMGIDRITPLRCDRSERKEIKPGRLEKIAVSAMKQSLKTVLTQIDAMVPFKQYMTEKFDGQLFVCYCDDNTPRTLLAKEYVPNRNVRILIGPEGDFSPEEVKLALNTGYQPVTLGDSRLRTETAGVFAVAQIHTLLQLCNDQL